MLPVFASFRWQNPSQKPVERKNVTARQSVTLAEVLKPIILITFLT